MAKQATRVGARKRVTVELRPELADEWRSLGQRNANKYLEESMVLALVRSHRITMSRGAELLGMRYQDFLDLLATNEMAILDYQPGEVARDVKTLNRWRTRGPAST